MEPVEVCGHTDLALGGRKFSGNAQRRKRRALLFHGTFLWGFDLSLVGRFLKFPSRQPDYREGRSHDDFLTNLPLSPALLKQALAEAWQAAGPLEAWPEQQTRRLAIEKYETEVWNRKF
jgi:lipoate---protein ligase